MLLADKTDIFGKSSVNTMGKQTLLGRTVPEISVLCRNHVFINGQNVSGKAGIKIIINLKVLGKLSAFFMLTSGLPEGAYVNPSSPISKIPAAFWKPSAANIISLKGRPFLCFCSAYVSTLLRLNFINIYTIVIRNAKYSVLPNF